MEGKRAAAGESRPPEGTGSLGPPAPPGLTPARTAAAFAAGLAIIAVSAVLVRRVELVSGQYLSTGVPPLTAFGGLLLLAAARPALLRLCPRLAPTRAQMLLIYAMATVGVVLCGLYHVRGFLPTLVSLQFWSREGGPLAAPAGYLPAWAVPTDPEAIRHYFVGAPDGRVPWSAWLRPLAWWSLFFLCLFLGVHSAMTLVARRWLRDERLSFPLLALPLALAAEKPAFGDPGSRRALFLIGFGIAALYNGVNIAHALAPAVPAIGFTRPLIAQPLEWPWTPLRPVRLYFELETIGIGYFVPLEVTFSIWFFYLLNRLGAIAGTAMGYDEPGFPFNQEQSMGGYLAIGLLLLLGLRVHLGRSLRRAFWTRSRDPEARRERLAWIGLAGSAAGMLAFSHAVGFGLKLAVPYFAVLALTALVYARIRGETGVPFQYVFPYSQPRELVLNGLSVPTALEWGGARGFVMFACFNWLSRWNHLPEQAAYQLDAIKLSEEARVPRRVLLLALLTAFLFGLWAAFGAHLGGYYDQGSNLIASAGGFGEYRERVARQEFQRVAGWMAQPPQQNEARLAATGFGFLFAAALHALRQAWVGCPFHPLGYLISTATGESCTSWFPMLAAWSCKWTVLRVGGLPLYRRGMPLFLGLAIGHLLIGGLLWPVFALTLSKEAANSYHLLFGE